MAAKNNAQDNRQKDLTAFELNSYFDKYFNKCLIFLTPVAIECLLIAFSPTVAAYIQKALKVEDGAKIQKEMRSALERFKNENFFNSRDSLGYLDGEVDYLEMLRPKSRN